MPLVQHLWNGLHGTSTRRDIRLEIETDVWLVEAMWRDRTVARWLFHDELTARAGVQQLIDADDVPGTWVDITAAFRASEDAARRRREA
jgi:hypothetical protein